MLTATIRNRIRLEQRQELVFGKCWIWLGYTGDNGYGRVCFDRRSRYVHRVVYEELIGRIPKGLQLDHLCRVRDCCNPRHLEPVTQLVNIRRGQEPTKTHCCRGHELSGHNLIIKSSRSRGQRACRTCMYMWQRARYRRLQNAKIGGASC
ncbi:HNH endonuclease [Mycobacterium paragordonae]|nr:HNH endonuclease [Mycobacterium paragordonae]TDL01130.1 HNH endonuclease [Mycobacterium paragordonae]